jgi:hypothetical protein
MNHLTLYENFKDFEEINYDEFFKEKIHLATDDEVDEFSRSDLFEITKILSGYVYITRDISQLSRTKKSLLDIHKRKGKDKADHPTYEDSPSFKVIKLSDDWFLLIDLRNKMYRTQRYYKCDQIYGVVNCLKSITNVSEGIFSLFKSKKDLKEPLYKQANFTDVQEYVESHEKDYITKSEFKTLYDVSKKVKYNKQWSSEDSRRFGTQIDFSYKHKDYTITKFEDEWFILRKMGERNEWRQGTSTYYLCDTIDGVINCIKSEI